MAGWIKLHRELFEKPIWINSTPEQKAILITLLSMASHENKQWEFAGSKYIIKPGEFITSLESIAKKTGKGVSIKNVRTALKRFESFEFLANKSTNKNRLISIVNWAIYQDFEVADGKQKGKQRASNGQATGNYQEYKELNNIDSITSNTIPEAVASDVPLVENEIAINWQKLLEQFNSITGKKAKIVNDKVKRSFRARLKEGYKKQDILDAILNCYNDPYHKETNHKYLTLEFISRADKLEYFISQKTKQK